MYCSTSHTSTGSFLAVLIHRTHNLKLHHRKVLFNSFHFNGHILGFYPETQTLEALRRKTVQYFARQVVFFQESHSPGF